MIDHNLVKKKRKLQLGDSSAFAKAKSIRVSPRKLALVADLIRNLDVESALKQLTFSKRRVALTVKSVLQSAIANAENNHSLDIDSLVVAEVRVGKAMVMKRFQARARGRSASIHKFFSNLTIVLKESVKGL